MASSPHLAVVGGSGAMAPSTRATQDHVALLFASRYKGKVRYDHDVGAWYSWTGTHWCKDETEATLQLVRSLARESACPAETGSRMLGSLSFIAGAEHLSRGDPALSVTSADWDRDPLLLGTPGGTVDLRTGELRDGCPTDGITKVTSVAPAPSAETPRWHRFLDEVTMGDPHWFDYCSNGQVIR